MKLLHSFAGWAFTGAPPASPHPAAAFWLVLFTVVAVVLLGAWRLAALAGVHPGGHATCPHAAYCR